MDRNWNQKEFIAVNSNMIRNLVKKCQSINSNLNAKSEPWWKRILQFLTSRSWALFRRHHVIKEGCNQDSKKEIMNSNVLVTKIFITNTHNIKIFCTILKSDRTYRDNYEDDTDAKLLYHFPYERSDIYEYNTDLKIWCSYIFIQLSNIGYVIIPTYRSRTYLLTLLIQKKTLKFHTKKQTKFFFKQCCWEFNSVTCTLRGVWMM